MTSMVLQRALAPAIHRVARGARTGAIGVLLWVQRWLACGCEAALQIVLFW
jgi:hypothetical protein